MKTRSIGSLTVSVVGVGCNNFGARLDEVRTGEVVEAALDAGITFFDTADTYGDQQSEEFLGRSLGARRDDVVVATKFGVPVPDGAGAAPEYVHRACEASLRRLGTDRIDLYQLHAPDDSVPIADTLGALHELVDEGKVREIGCSNFTAAQLAEAETAAKDRARFRSVQNQYSLLWRAPEDDGVLAACASYDLALLPYYPLANGLLTGKVVRGEPPPKGTRLAALPAERRGHWLSDELLGRVESIRAIADAHGVSMLSLAFSWLLSKEAVASVIAGASSPVQVRANAAAPVSLPEGVLDELDRASKAS
ncbi:MAG TPA: aldo/keto reductase [Acidimicrobiales bacterium]|nr:aldo/keto reductase [Acidimicrobiales bacterium]